MSEHGGSSDSWLRTVLNGAAGPVLGAVATAALAGGGLWLGLFSVEVGSRDDDSVAEPVRTVTVTAPGPTVTVSVPESSDQNDETQGDTAGSSLTYLADLEPAAGSFRVDSREVHGREVLRSIVQELECPAGVEWNLGGGYKEFSAWAGLDDESRNRDARARFTVIGDGQVLDEIVLGLAEHWEFAINVEEVSRLVLEMELISPDRCFYHAEGVWGDAALR